MSKRNSISKRFSRGAKQYSREAKLHRQLAEHLSAGIDVAAAPERILELGCGTGFLTQLLAQRFPDTGITAIDISDGMLAVARENISSELVDFISADALDYESGQRFGLICSSSAIQWMTPHTRLFAKLATLLNPNGQLHFSAMVKGTLQELHEARKAIAPDKVARQVLPSAEELSKALEMAGFLLASVTKENYVSQYESAHDFLKTISRHGFTGGDFSAGAQPLNRREIRELLAYYERRFPHDDAGVFANFSILTIRAKI